MRIRVVLTDLDGTLLEGDGTLLPEAVEVWRRLVREGVPVCPMSSKTAAEVALLLESVGVDAPAGCENGGVVAWPGGEVEVLDGAVPVAELRRVAVALRESTGAPLVTFDELSDSQLEALTGLRGAALAAARTRLATLPLRVDQRWEQPLRAALPPSPKLRLVRGNRFLHLQGDHDKCDAALRLLERLPAVDGCVMACGDAANDIELLRMADLRLIVPGPAGPDPILVRAFPDAMVAEEPSGRGWGGALLGLLHGRIER